MFDQDEGDDGMQVVEEFYPDDAIDSEQILSKSNQGDGFVQDIQQGLQRSEPYRVCRRLFYLS